MFLFTVDYVEEEVSRLASKKESVGLTDEDRKFAVTGLQGVLDSVETMCKEGIANSGGQQLAPKGGAVQGVHGRSPWTADLSHVTGKTAQSRNRAIQSVIDEDLSNLKLTHQPQYSPFANQGVAKRGVETQIGKKAFESRGKLRDTIVHEELHHRWWKLYHNNESKNI